ncbi:MAG: D-alanyl-D-alanine carboxypeptidase/D-alanyl-D-alanine-endopeptidase, partial [Candidatus Sumerlaeia bacterium]|nr:D-alanyl-D-alanine carboxypeptidase/D-alanyl-D-alanine-endopeptidase [Candidatus Sumerlaeia bacterium]
MPILSSVPFRAFLLMGTLTCSLLLAAPEKQPLAELQKSLAVGLEKSFNAPKYASAHWGVRVEKLDGTVLYDWQGKKAFMPASQMKVFTTAAALDLLGPEYRYTTRVELHGEQRDTTFHGDVVLVGSGDPTLGAWHGEGVKESAVLLKEWTEALKARGINRIEGRIIGDGRVFTKEFIHTGWHYGDLPYWYAAGSSGLAMEENAFRCEIKAGANVGDKATVTWTPATAYINVLVDTVTVEEKAPSTADSFNYQTEGNTIWFGGQIPKGTVVKERASIWDGVRYSAFLFTEMCEKEGITVTGEAANILDVSPLQDATPELLLVHQSVPMQEICTVINQVSHNFYADQVLRTLG